MNCFSFWDVPNELLVKRGSAAPVLTCAVNTT